MNIFESGEYYKDSYKYVISIISVNICTIATERQASDYNYLRYIGQPLLAAHKESSYWDINICCN